VRSDRSRKIWLTAFVGLTIATYAFVNRPVKSNVAWTTEFDHALATARDRNVPVVLEFWTSGCMYCRMMEREVLTDPRVERALNKLIPVRVQWSSEPELAERYRVEAFPTFLVLSGDGSVIGRTMGYQPPEAFLRFLDGARTKSAASVLPSP